jgi:hypothetical protein
MNLEDDEHITDLPLVSPTAGLAELIEHVFRMENWRRSREPAADGGILPKFVRWRDLVNAGLVTYSNGEINAGGDVFRPITPVVSVAEGGGTLLLTVDRFPFFSFPSATSHVAQAPGETMLTFTAKLLNLTGAATFAAEAFDARSGGASLGTFVLGGSGNTRTMTAAQFVSLGVDGSVRRVRVTATMGTGGAEDFIDVFRQDPSTTDPFLFLSNPSHAVQTDVDGEGGNYADAFTHAAVFEGITDTTADWDWEITPDAGVTATINGGAGPVANPPTVTVAVSDMTVPTGIVLVKATQVGETDLTADFLINKQEASATGYTAFFTPRQEILLPITDAGEVSSYADAWSDLKIVKNGAIDDTANWSLSKEDVNVTSTLVDARVTVTALLSLGTFDGSLVINSLTMADLGTNTNGLVNVYYGGGVWIALGWKYGGGGSDARSKIFRSTDYINWTVVDVGVSANWQEAAYDQGAWVIVRMSTTTDTHKIVRSTDGGLTWSEVTLPTTSTLQWYSLWAGGGKIMLAGIGHSSGAYSTDGGASWSTFTWPTNTITILALSASLSFARNSSGVQYISTNHGASWTNDDTNWPTDCFEAIVYKGRLVASIWASTPTAKYRDPAGSWVTVALPHNVSNGRFQIIEDVLYMMSHGGGTPVYTTDGATWKACSAHISGYPVRGGQNQEVDFYPVWELGGNGVHRRALQANSDTDGAVIVTATKPGALDIEVALPVLKGTAPRDAYAFSAQPAYLVLPATSDGIVTNFANAVMNFFAQKNGINDTANWTWTWTTTNLTPASGTGPTVTLTAMSQSQDAGFITVTFSKPGQAVRTEVLNVHKIRGNLPAGPIVGGAYAAVTTTTTHIALRFNKDGRVQQRVTSGGVWTDLTGWAGRVHATANQGFWLKVIPTAGTHALTSGTENTWLAMTSDRDFVMEDATSGTHKYDFTVLIATDNTGANPIIGFGSMTIIVP